MNKKISLDDKIQINSSTKENISDNEKYILDSIEDGKITNFNEAEFMKKVKEDAVKNGLLKETKIEWGKWITVFILSVFFMVIIIFVCISSLIKSINSLNHIPDWKLATLVLPIVLVYFLSIFLGVYFYTYIRKTSNNSYVRTKKGEELNENLEGLKNFLKDYSTMHNKDEKSLTLWEDYLIYSVIFNQNTNVIKNIWDKYIENV